MGLVFSIRTSSEFVRRWTVVFWGGGGLSPLLNVLRCLFCTKLLLRKMIDAAFPVSPQEHTDTGLTTAPATEECY